MCEEFDHSALVIEVVPCSQRLTVVDSYAVSAKDLIEVDLSSIHAYPANTIRVVPKTQRFDMSVVYLTSWENLVAVDSSLVSGLKDAIQGRDYRRAFYLICLKNDYELGFRGGPHGETALHSLAISGHKYLFETVLRRMNTDDVLIQTSTGPTDIDHGHTVLHVIASHGCTVALQSLIEIRPELMCTLANIVNYRKHTPLWIAISQGHDKVAELLFEYTDISKLGCSDRFGLRLPYCDLLERVIKDKARDGCTALHMAAYLDWVSMAKVIYDEMSCEEVCKLSDQGYTALHIAIMKGSHEMVKALLDDRENEKSRGLWDTMTAHKRSVRDLARKHSKDMYNCLISLSEIVEE